MFNSIFMMFVCATTLVPSLAMADTELNCSVTASFKKEGRVTVLPIQKWKYHIEDNSTASFTNKIDGTNFTFTVDVGLTENPDLDDESGTYIGYRTLKELTVFNESHSQMAMYSVPPLEVNKHINLTLGGDEPLNSGWRLHAYCGIY